MRVYKCRQCFRDNTFDLVSHSSISKLKGTALCKLCANERTRAQIKKRKKLVAEEKNLFYKSLLNTTGDLK